MKTEIIKTPDNHDSDTLVFHGKYRGHGYVGKKSGNKGLKRCPECGKENYAMAVASGCCAWCPFDLEKTT